MKTLTLNRVKCSFNGIMFDEVPQESFDEREKKILKFWQNEKLFEKSVAQRKDGPLFAFYDGPPFATGLASLWPYSCRNDQRCCSCAIKP